MENPGTNLGLRLHRGGGVPDDVAVAFQRTCAATFNAEGLAEYAHDIACFGRLWQTKTE